MKRLILFLIIPFSISICFAQNLSVKPNGNEMWDFIDHLPQGELSPSDIEKLNPLLLAPGNDACLSATTLVVDAACTAGTTNAGTVQPDPTGGCGNSAGGGGCGNPTSVWYNFNTGAFTSLNLDIDITQFGNCANWFVAVYGPFASVAAGCMPTNASAVFCLNNSLLQSDNKLLTGLTANKVYLVQILQLGANGGANTPMNFCINVTQPLPNDDITGATVISSCGAAFTGSTANANSNECGANGNDLDCNGASQCGTCGVAGTDVTYSIENDSWFTFCAVAAGTWNVTLGGVSACSLPAGNGLQFAVFTGTPGNLTQVFSGNGAGNGIGNGAVPATQTTTNFAVAAGQCAYMMVDGFAGNECTYTFTLANVTGGCTLLPIELLNFTGEFLDRRVQLKWSTLSEQRSEYFTIEKSTDGVNFEFFSQVKAAGNSSVKLDYSATDFEPAEGINYFRLRETDYDGNVQVYSIISVNAEKFKKEILVYPNPSAGETNISFNSNSQYSGLMNVYDYSGAKIVSQDLDVKTGENNFILRNPMLTKGIYFVQLNLNGKISTVKLMIE